ncbi:MAG: hypothetical protein R2941_16940 [Desulfobacterales bacterium]
MQYQPGICIKTACRKASEFPDRETAQAVSLQTLTEEKEQANGVRIMFQIKINYKRNALLNVMSGRIDAEEARSIVRKFQEGVNKLKPGFAVITDITDFVPTTEEVRNILRDATRYAVKHGLGRTVRIVSNNLTSSIGSIQFNRTEKNLGCMSEVVTSLSEAKKILGWK